MKASSPLAACTGAALLGLAAAAHALPLVANGGFESGFASWTTVEQAGSDGGFFLQNGAASPLGADPVPAPPEGASAAMSDAAAPGTHVLYQDFLASAGAGATELRFDLFLGNRADRYATPSSLDFALTSPPGAGTHNQQARVDILRAGADPFSVEAADVLLALYRTQLGDALVAGYFTVAADVTALLAAHDGELLRLRFAEVDNLGPFQMGVDNVRFAALPEPPPAVLLGAALAGLAGARGARRRTAARAA